MIEIAIIAVITLMTVYTTVAVLKEKNTRDYHKRVDANHIIRNKEKFSKIRVQKAQQFIDNNL